MPVTLISENAVGIGTLDRPLRVGPCGAQQVNNPKHALAQGDRGVLPSHAAVALGDLDTF